MHAVGGFSNPFHAHAPSHFPSPGHSIKGTAKVYAEVSCRLNAQSQRLTSPGRIWVAFCRRHATRPIMCGGYCYVPAIDIFHLVFCYFLFFLLFRPFSGSPFPVHYRKMIGGTRSRDCMQPVTITSIGSVRLAPGSCFFLYNYACVSRRNVQLFSFTCWWRLVLNASCLCYRHVFLQLPLSLTHGRLPSPLNLLTYTPSSRHPRQEIYMHAHAAASRPPSGFPG